jgi:hypothetical protein
MAFHREVWVVFSGLIAFLEEDQTGTKEVSKAILVRDRDHSPSMFLCGEEVTIDGRRVEIKWLNPPPGAPRTTRRSTAATGKLPRSPEESEDFRWVPSAADLGLGRADGKLVDDEIDDAGLARVRARVTWDHGELCVGHLVAYPPPHDEQDEAPVPALEFPVSKKSVEMAAADVVVLKMTPHLHGGSCDTLEVSFYDWKDSHRVSRRTIRVVDDGAPNGAPGVTCPLVIEIANSYRRAGHGREGHHFHHYGAILEKPEEVPIPRVPDSGSFCFHQPHDTLAPSHTLAGASSPLASDLAVTLRPWNIPICPFILVEA